MNRLRINGLPRESSQVFRLWSLRGTESSGYRVIRAYHDSDEAAKLFAACSIISDVCGPKELRSDAENYIRSTLSQPITVDSITALVLLESLQFVAEDIKRLATARCLLKYYIDAGMAGAELAKILMGDNVFSELLAIEEGAKGSAVASSFNVLNYRLLIEPLDKGNVSLRDLIDPKEFEIVLVTLDQGTPKRIVIKYDDLEFASWSVRGNLKSLDNSLVLKQGLDVNQFLDEVAKGTPISVVRVAGMRGAWVLGLRQSGYY